MVPWQDNGLKLLVYQRDIIYVLSRLRPFTIESGTSTVSNEHMHWDSLHPGGSRPGMLPDLEERVVFP